MYEGLTSERLEELESRVFSELLEMTEGLELVEEVRRLRAALEQVRNDLAELMETTHSPDRRKRVAEAAHRVREALGIADEDLARPPTPHLLNRA